MIYRLNSSQGVRCHCLHQPLNSWIFSDISPISHIERTLPLPTPLTQPLNIHWYIPFFSTVRTLPLPTSTPLNPWIFSDVSLISPQGVHCPQRLQPLNIQWYIPFFSTVRTLPLPTSTPLNPWIFSDISLISPQGVHCHCLHQPPQPRRLPWPQEDGGRGN